MTGTDARRAAALFAVMSALSAAGCVVGPDFKRPVAPAADGYTAEPPPTTASAPNVAGGEAQRIVAGSDIAGDWWTLFHSKALNDLIEEALAHNHDLKAARAALLVARETVLAQRGVFLPNLSASFAASHQRQSGTLAPATNTNASIFSLLTPQVSVSYPLDIFGLERRNAEAAKAQEQSVRYQMIAADITLTNNVVAAVIQQASLRAQIEATRRLIALYGQAVETLKYQLSRGYADRLDLAAQESQLAQASATLPPLLKLSDQQDHLLAVLAGRPPNAPPMAHFDLSALALPSDLPVSLPSALVIQRPDVLQAEAALHAASAQVGVATANRLPNIQLTANAGATALAIDQVFAPGNGFWSVGATLAAPIFDGGTLLHQQRAARAAYVEAAEQYRGTVLGAFQNVADTLTALEQDAEGLKAAASAEDAAKVTLDLSGRQWRAGYASYLTFLSAEQAYQQARIGRVQAQANRFADTAALFQALGGGWWRRADLAGDTHGR